MNKSIHFVLQIDVGCAKYEGGEKTLISNSWDNRRKVKMDDTFKIEEKVLNKR